MALDHGNVPSAPPVAAYQSRALSEHLTMDRTVHRKLSLALLQRILTTVLKVANAAAVSVS